MHHAFVARRLSPGGCADLLAISDVHSLSEFHSLPGFEHWVQSSSA